MIIEYFTKIVQKLYILLNSDMENEYVHIVKHVCKTTLRRILLRRRKFSEGFCRQNEERYFIFKYFFIENFLVYERMWKKCCRSRHRT